MIPEAAKKHHPVVALTDEILRLTSRISELFAGVSESTGLSSMQFTVLTAVAESRTPPTVPQIGRSLGHPRQVIQRAANVLQEEGLVKAVDNPHHKRAPLLVATVAGKKVKQDADLIALKSADELLAMTDIETCEKLTDELHRIRGKIETHIKSRSGNHGVEAQSG